MNQEVPGNKGQIRRMILDRRNLLSNEERQAKSRAITDHLCRWDHWGRARVIMSYVSFASEVDTEAINRAVLSRGKMLFLPKVEKDKKEISIYEVTDLARDLVPGPWGIKEPDPCCCPLADTSKLDLVLVPGVAFDRTGGRIGYGKGFYDRFLASLQVRGLKPKTVGLAFFLQVVAKVDWQPHDFRLEAVLTENGWLGEEESKYCS
jgi:5-formyltetrahydrofolate cyclo-ligase